MCLEGKNSPSKEASSANRLERLAEEIYEEDEKDIFYKEKYGEIANLKEEMKGHKESVIKFSEIKESVKEMIKLKKSVDKVEEMLTSTEPTMHTKIKKKTRQELNPVCP